MRLVLKSVAGFGWVVALPLVFLVYANSFNTFPIIEKRHSVLADADSANFIHLVRDFDLGRVYGDPYARKNRDVPDNAQKHKIHHVLYVGVASLLHLGLVPLYSLLGLPASQAAYGVNALLACFNMVLIFALFRAIFPRLAAPGPFLLFYPLALSTWIYGSAPESWPFSGTLILLFLLALCRGNWPATALAALVGFFMLNNLILVFLLVLLFLELVRRGTRLAEALFTMLKAGLVSLGTWVALLTGLSFFDKSFRPDQYALYTLWFKQYVDPNTSIFSPYVWKSVLTNLFVNSVVSNQPDPFVPQEALRTTILGGGIGAVAVVAYLGLAALVLFRAARVFSARLRTERADRVRALLEDRAAYPLAFCGVMVFVTIFLYHPSGFLYSTTVLPLMTLVIGGFLDSGSRWQMACYYGTLILMAVNNAGQVLTFRNALAAM